jgi:hypothetical protein
MDEIITERSESVLRIQLNRPMKRNAMTSRMYATLSDVFNAAAKDEHTRVELWHGAGDSLAAMEAEKEEFSALVRAEESEGSAWGVSREAPPAYAAFGSVRNAPSLDWAM